MVVRGLEAEDLGEQGDCKCFTEIAEIYHITLTRRAITNSSALMMPSQATSYSTARDRFRIAAIGGGSSSRVAIASESLR